ncbi:T9SS type A sorting domain-containing protein [Flavobacterium sangjuense]|uniref:Secretion system C-terminal sorting domain-containing protein n=1 Tax=Flavobacterium sangjuense TaxID=2518177 RepID=A0A4P7PV71_9FLAO|nr:T9SS type A sorting domain-containing protein [Flavobacterium sangjuense]QBZ98891.1 hypothetical protein GS03_02403 [Flavobacterium sangjuense]
MKTKLLSITLMMVLFTSITKAQTKIWDFGNDTTTWPVTGSGVGTIGADTQAVIDNLGLFSNDPSASGDIVNFGSINASAASFSDGFTAVNRFQLNGAGYPSAGGFIPMPTQRYIFFDVNGACTVKVWFKTGSNGTVRTVYVTDGTATVGSGASNSGGNADLVIVTANATAAGRYYIYADAACNLYKVSVVGATVNTVLANNDFQTTSPVKAYTNGRQIHLSNVLSKTQVEVYSVTGALIRTINTEADTSFDVLNAGVYILKIKSEEGQKSVKVVVQ